MKIREKISDFITENKWPIFCGVAVVASTCYGICIGRSIERLLSANGWMKILEVDPELYPRIMDAGRKALGK